MQLKTYLEKLNRLVKANPEALTMEVITATDDEGNNFNPIYYDPSIGHFDDVNGFDNDARFNINAVCLN